MMLTRILACFALCASLWAGQSVIAAEAPSLYQDPVLEQRLLAISEDLRCLVCQNETLAASHAELADDLRREIRAMLREGKSNDEVIEFLVVRYGDFVRYKPPFKPSTWLLWLAPFLMLILGGGLLYRVLKNQTETHPESETESQEVSAS